MLHHMWVVQVRPPPIHSLRIPVGVLLTHHGEDATRPASAKWISAEHSPLIQACVENKHLLGTHVDIAAEYFTPVLQGTHADAVATRINEVRSQLNNHLHLEPSRPFVAGSAEEATLLAFDSAVRLPGLLEEKPAPCPERRTPHH